MRFTPGFYSNVFRTIKSIQAGTIAITNLSSAQVTITAVDVSRSIVFLVGFTIQTGVTNLEEKFPRVVLLNSTTVWAGRDATVTDTKQTTVGYVVVEFE